MNLALNNVQVHTNNRWEEHGIWLRDEQHAKHMRK